MMLQNLGLACEALGIGGFPNFATVDAGWLEGLGFRTLRMPTSRFLGVPLPVRTALRLKRQDVVIRYPIGLEVDGETILRREAGKPRVRLSRTPLLDIVRQVCAVHRAAELVDAHGISGSRP
jgi:hypothetical protein